MDMRLERSNRIEPCRGPLLLVVADGVGIGLEDEWDAVHQARTPTLDGLLAGSPWRTLRAHGVAVGLPSDADMGNSEVGHNALGAGRVIDQGAKLVNRAIAERSILCLKACRIANGRLAGALSMPWGELVMYKHCHSYIAVCLKRRTFILIV